MSAAAVLFSVSTKKYSAGPKFKTCLFHLTLPTQQSALYPNSFIPIFSCHIFFLVLVAKANLMQTNVKVYLSVFSGARGVENCATIYQMTP